MKSVILQASVVVQELVLATECALYVFCEVNVTNTWAATWQNQQIECAPSEDSDQPGYPPCLINVFAVRTKKAWIINYQLNAQRSLWSDWADAQADLSPHQTGRMPRLIWVFAGRTVIFCWFLSCHGILV